jgi:hypothetical protein
VTLAFIAALKGHVPVLELLRDCFVDLETPTNVRRPFLEVETVFDQVKHKPLFPSLMYCRMV